MTSTARELADRFSDADAFSVDERTTDFPIIQVSNQFATASIALQGAQVISYERRNERPILWISECSKYEQGTAVRGGVPICWPWFGKHQTDSTNPSHGFVRTAFWALIDFRTLGNGASQLRFEIRNHSSSTGVWPHAFCLTLIVTVGESLQLRLETENRDVAPFQITEALHSYFAVSGIDNIEIDGLAGTAYYDAVAAAAMKTQDGRLRITGETDRVYLDTSSDSCIYDSAWARTIHIRNKGSRSTVVWNPWQEKARRMADFGDTDYKTMVCVESGNVFSNIVTVGPGEHHILETEIAVASN